MGHYDPKFSNEFVSIFEKEEIERSQVQKNLKNDNHSFHCFLIKYCFQFKFSKVRGKIHE